MTAAGRQHFWMRYGVFAAFAGAFFVVQLLRNVNAVMTPHLTASFHASTADLGVLTSVYFLSFALMQLPVGVLLDRFGPRRVQAALLPVIAAGAGLTWAAQSFGEVMLARALIGAGAAAALMAPLKAMSEWFPKERLALVNGLIMATGSTGAIVAGGPLEWSLRQTDWRTVFAGLGVMALLAVPCVLATGERARATRIPGIGELARGFGAIVRMPVFVRVFPLYIATHSVFLSYQGLWMVPWLTTVDGFGHAEAAACVSLVALTTAIGYALTGGMAQRLQRGGIPLIVTVGWGMGLCIVVQCAMAAELGINPYLLWALYGILGGTGILCYAILAHEVPGDLVGRSNSILNLVLFVTAFAVQAGVGVLAQWLHATPGTEPGAYAHRAVLWILIALQCATLAWFLLAPKSHGLAPARDVVR